MKKRYVTSSIFVLSSLFLTSFAWALSSLTPTIYYIKTIDPNQDCEDKKTIYSVEGKALVKACRDTYKSCVIEGTCAILKHDSKTNSTSNSETGSSAAPAIDFDVINYINTKNERPLFAHVDEKKCPWGLGVKSICLDPYFTVAADLSIHKAGEVIFVDKLKGVKLPTGEVHAGFLIVRDKGGAIKGEHRFDFYTGLIPYKDERNPFTPVGLNSKNNKFEYRKATKEEAEQFRKERNFPGIPL